jgi:hypothetical protein
MKKERNGDEVKEEKIRDEMEIKCQKREDKRWNGDKCQKREDKRWNESQCKGEAKRILSGARRPRTKRKKDKPVHQFEYNSKI